VTRVEAWGVVAAFVFGLYSLLQAVPPASWWLDVRSVTVVDSTEGNPIFMTVDRDVNRDFTGIWSVDLRRLDPDTGGWISECVTDETRQPYFAGAALRRPLTLDYWASPECADLGPGTYFITTMWRINPDGLMPRTLQISSPPFMVSPRV